MVALRAEHLSPRATNPASHALSFVVVILNHAAAGASPDQPETPAMITLWGRASSSNVQKVMWTLAELGLAHERIPAGLSFGVVKTPDYAALNPNAVVPTLRDGDLLLWESDAIVRHLARKYGAGTLWPADETALALADQWATWTLSTLNPRVFRIFHATARTPKAAQDFNGLDRVAGELAGVIAILDDALAAKPYVAGDAFTWGDIPTSIVARRALSLPFGAPTAPHVAAWIDRLRPRPGFPAFEDGAEGTCLEEWRLHEQACG
jgi:glutathione S-transferase